MATDIKLDADGGDTLVLEGAVIAMRGRPTSYRSRLPMPGLGPYQTRASATC